ncbi:hypothetical protein EB73_29680 [Mycobacterium sp. SWH-M3]|nr:hypothetical protein EB73_29680 [Mycobacterium sp. SWH-M3]
MDQNLVVVDETLDGMELVQQIGVERTDHVWAHRPNHAVDNIAVSAEMPARPIGLGTSTVWVVVAANDVNVGICSLATRMTADQMQIGKPKST